MEENDAKRTSLIEPQAFIIAEYSALRREIELEIKEIGEYLRYAVVSSGAIWAWLLLKSQPQISRIGCMLPFVLSTLLLVQTVVLRKKILFWRNILHALSNRLTCQMASDGKPN